MRCAWCTPTDAYANLVLPKLLTERGITGRDAAFATELLAGTCRGRGHLRPDHRRWRRPSDLASLQPAVLDLLRLGTHSLLAMATPVHAAVAATVDLAADHGGGAGHRAGERGAPPGGRPDVGRVDRRADRRGWRGRRGWPSPPPIPRWIVDAFADVLPADELEPALLADNVPAAVTLAVRPGLAERSELVAAGACRLPYSPFAARWSGNPADLASVREGRVGVQDEGSQLVAWGLTRATAPAGWWLDLCAGPGGKTALLTGLAAATGSRVLAADVAPHRARLVEARCAPTRVQPASSWPTPPGQPGVRAPSAGCWPTCRVPDWAHCDAVPKRGGGARARRSSSCTDSRWNCCAAL